MSEANGAAGKMFRRQPAGGADNFLPRPELPSWACIKIAWGLAQP